jgi:hypothetical protein
MCVRALSLSDKALAKTATLRARFSLCISPICRFRAGIRPSQAAPRGFAMMAFAFFLLWIIASLGLLTVWVFRQTPAVEHERAEAIES